MDDLRNILRQVQEGKASFAPTGPSEEEMKTFQPIAKALLYAHQMGYLEECHAKREYVTGRGYYVLVLVRGGLSYIGEAFFREEPAGGGKATNPRQVPDREDTFGLRSISAEMAHFAEKATFWQADEERMASPLFPKINKRIADAFEKLDREQVTPWFFLRTEGGLKVKAFDGRSLNASGLEFSGSIRELFWGRYIEPFIEKIVQEEIEFCVSESKEHGLDLRVILPEVKTLLVRNVQRIFHRMAEVDQRLRGNGYPESVKRENTEDKVARVTAFITEHVEAELAMYKHPSKLEVFYAKNPALRWVLAVILIPILLFVANKLIG